MESRYTLKNQILFGLRNFAVTAAIIIVLGYLVISSNQAARQEIESIISKEKNPITYIDEPVVYGYENGAKIWEVRSEVAKQDVQSESSELTRIYELILYKGGEENVRIRGDHGNWDKPREQLTLIGNVHVESADGTTNLDTQKLTWSEQSKTLGCPEKVDFTVEENHVIANSLYSADDLATIDFVGDVEMFVMGLEGANFITREGEFPVEDIRTRAKGDGMNVLAQFVHYDKGDKTCECLPSIPLRVRSEHKLDEAGRAIPEPPGSIVQDPFAELENPAYLEALQRSVQQLDLTEEERSFLEGRIDRFQIEPLQSTAAPEPPGVMGMAPIPGQTNLTGPLSQGFPSPLPPPPPQLPRSDPEIVLAAPDYSGITAWQVSPDLNGEKYEGDPDFDPKSELRDGMIFCYRKNKKIWCEEVHIDLGEHRIEALRRVDVRLSNLREGAREEAESKVGRTIQSTPTQIIGNYVIHNWEKSITEGYQRVLAIQPEKDIEADNIIYYEDSDATHAWGSVIVHQCGGRWWELTGALQDISSERAKEDIRQPSVITCDALLSYSKRVSWAFGNVVFRQEKQVATSDRAQYEDPTEILVLAGTVDFTSEKGEQVRAAVLTLDLYLEEYIAEGAAVARNVVPEEYREDIDKYRNDEERQPGDDARTRLLESRTAEGLGDWTEAVENPPPPPPIEVLPDSQNHVQSLPPLGPEVPPAGSSPGPITPSPETGADETGQGSVAQPETSIGGDLSAGESEGVTNQSE
jgi:LPS export ABC transporter protein LptC